MVWFWFQNNEIEKFVWLRMKIINRKFAVGMYSECRLCILVSCVGLLFALTRRQTMRSHPSIYSSEDCTKKLSYFLSKGNWCPKENYTGTKEHKLEATRPFCLNLWEQYTAGSISTTRVLNQCGRVDGPVVEAES